MCLFRAQNGQFVLNKIFLVETIIITFIYLLALFIVQNLKKFLQRIQSYRMHHFWAQNGPFASILGGWGGGWGGGIIIILIYQLAPFIVQNFKKIFQRIQSYEDVQFLGPKWPICPNENFFEKPVNEPYFLHSCLPTCQKSVRC